MSNEQAVATPTPGRFSYIKYDLVSVEQQEAFKRKFEELEQMIVAQLGAGRPQSLTLTALEEAYMWIGKSIRDNQVYRTKVAVEQPERGNE